MSGDDVNIDVIRQVQLGHMACIQACFVGWLLVHCGWTGQFIVGGLLSSEHGRDHRGLGLARSCLPQVRLSADVLDPAHLSLAKGALLNVNK